MHEKPRKMLFWFLPTLVTERSHRDVIGSEEHPTTLGVSLCGPRRYLPQPEQTKPAQAWRFKANWFNLNGAVNCLCVMDLHWSDGPIHGNVERVGWSRHYQRVLVSHDQRLSKLGSGGKMIHFKNVYLHLFIYICLIYICFYCDTLWNVTHRRNKSM